MSSAASWGIDVLHAWNWLVDSFPVTLAEDSSFDSDGGSCNG